MVLLFWVTPDAFSAAKNAAGLEQVKDSLAKVSMSPAQRESVNKKLNELSKDAGAITPATLTDALNKIAAEAGLAGTEFLDHSDPNFWLYRARFSLSTPPPPKYLSFWPVTVEGRKHVLFPPSADDKLTLKRGDEVIFPAAGPLVQGGKGGDAVKMQVRSSAGDALRDVEAALSAKTPDLALLALVTSTSRTIEAGSVKAGYLALPVLDRLDYRHEYLDILKVFERDMDYVILDLRGPFGRGGVSGTRMFFDGKTRKAVTKPLFVLVDKDTAGGREELAAKFQRDAKAVVIGEETAGDQQQVNLFEIDPGKIMMVSPRPTKKVHTSAKVVPDYKVSDPVAWSNGQDPVIEQVRKLLAEKKKK